MRYPRNLLRQEALAAPFPWIGECHPLRQSYVQFLYTAASLAFLLHLCTFMAWSMARMGPAPAVIPLRQMVFTVLPPPPSVDQAPAKNIQILAPDLKVGIPDPVADFKASLVPLPTNDEIEDAYSRESLTLPRLGPSDSAVFRVPEPEATSSPGPNDYVAFTEPPVIISLPAPVYPEMARQAALDGVVVLRVLVGKDGKVKDARIEEGATLLNDAALEAARNAIFRPALEQHHPVEVWVELRMRFSLN